MTGRRVFHPIGSIISFFRMSSEIPLILEIIMVMVSASRIKHRATVGTLVRALQILADGQFRSADSTQDRTPIPFVSRPNFNRVTSQCLVTVLARIIGVAALHSDCDDVQSTMVMSTSGLSIKTNPVSVVSKIRHALLK